MIRRLWDAIGREGYTIGSLATAMSEEGAPVSERTVRRWLNEEGESFPNACKIFPRCIAKAALFLSQNGDRVLEKPRKELQ